MTNEQLAITLNGLVSQLDTALAAASSALEGCDAVRHREYIGPGVPFLDRTSEHYTSTGDFVALDPIKEARNGLQRQVKILTGNIT